MMTDSIKADVLYFKTLPYEEIFRLFNDFENMEVVLFDKMEDFVFYSKIKNGWSMILNKHRPKEHMKYKMIYLYGLILSGLADKDGDKEPFKSNIEEYNAEFDALYNK